MKIKLEYFPSGKLAGICVYWLRYRTYISWTFGWKGKFAYPKDKPRLLLRGDKWWYGGGLMLITTRIEWNTDYRFK
jgi:hypothetical protein